MKISCPQNTKPLYPWANNLGKQILTLPLQMYCFLLFHKLVERGSVLHFQAFTIKLLSTESLFCNTNQNTKCHFQNSFFYSFQFLKLCACGLSHNCCYHQLVWTLGIEENILYYGLMEMLSKSSLLSVIYTSPWCELANVMSTSLASRWSREWKKYLRHTPLSSLIPYLQIEVHLYNIIFMCTYTVHL